MENAGDIPLGESNRSFGRPGSPGGSKCGDSRPRLSGRDVFRRGCLFTEAFRMEEGGSVVARLSVHCAEFWVGDEAPEHANFSPQTLGGGSVRIILTVADPDAVFARAVKAGAAQVYPVGEEYGWRLGRVVDPFGHHWEIGRPLA